MPVSVTIHVDPESDIGEIISDLYAVMHSQPYTPESLIPVLCAFEFTDWTCDGDEAYKLHRELREAISVAVAHVFEHHGCDAKNGTERTCCKE